MSSPVVLSPALPSELLTYILNYHAHPTALIICSSRSDFLSALAEDLRPQAATEQSETETDRTQTESASETQSARVGQALLSSTLYQVGISRHIRVVYVPTVTHLRAYLSVFSPQDSKITSPPPTFNISHRKPPHIVVYGVLDMHRGTSEWSAQGLGDTAAVLVETGHRLGWPLVVVDPRVDRLGFEELLKEELPILSGGARRRGLDSDEGAWSGRAVEVGRVLGRWFQYRRGVWDENMRDDQQQREPDQADDED